ncbi:hypothetical protein A9G39_10370 [Gilliamella sp. Imp1-6]|nr:hypothetical protein A9G39_10370 [Gilliamella apicola]
MVVFTVNASVSCVYDNNNNGAKNSADFDNKDDLNSNGGLDNNGDFNNHLDIDDNFAEYMTDDVTEDVTEDVVEESADSIASKDPDDGVDFATRNDFDDENNCGDLLWLPCESIRFRA